MCVCVNAYVCVCVYQYVCVGTVEREGSRGLFFERESGWGYKRKGKAGRGKGIYKTCI